MVIEKIHFYKKTEKFTKLSKNGKKPFYFEKKKKILQKHVKKMGWFDKIPEALILKGNM